VVSFVQDAPTEYAYDLRPAAWRGTNDRPKLRQVAVARIDIDAALLELHGQPRCERPRTPATASE